jgi:hypothetical protein
MNQDQTNKKKFNPVINGLIEALNNNMALLAQQQNQSHKQIIESISRPKQVIRDASGKVQGVF